MVPRATLVPGTGPFDFRMSLFPLPKKINFIDDSDACSYIQKKKALLLALVTVCYIDHK